MNVKAAIADRRIRAALGGAIVVLVAVVVIAVASGGSSSAPPPDEAARLVPSTALVYVHVSTDTGRDATRTALKLAQRFPSFARLRNSLLRRLLAPQGGVLGAAGVLLDQPGLKGAGIGLVAHAKSARLVVRSELDPSIKHSQTFKPFEPTLDAQVPKGVLGYLGVSGLSTALSRVLAAAGPQTAGLGALLRRAGRQLDQQSGGRLTGEVLAALQGEVA